ncbi:MAG: hypothetical protein IKO94_07970, partial [Selenomonadaceae bacterium]|nr:hypothetical protein [Selenomonadaceae bacterium]
MKIFSKILFATTVQNPSCNIERIRCCLAICFFDQGIGKFLDDVGIAYKVQDKEIISDSEIRQFVKRFDHILLHFDIDAMDEKL